jgi:hypothetical protein
MILSLLLILCQAVQSQPTTAPESKEPPSVVVGTLRITNLRTHVDAVRAKSEYVHDNEQPLVLVIERTLSGPDVQGMVSVMMQIDRANGAKVTWEGSYGLLDAEQWRPSRRLIAVLDGNYFWGGRCIDATNSRYCTKLSQVFLLEEH